MSTDSHPSGTHPSGSHPWGRVADDGTVYVRTSEGERVVGIWQAGSPDEALAFFTRRYDSLATEVSLLERRISTTDLAPSQAKATIKTNRGDIVINLLNSKAPCTVNSFVYLASKKFFSNTQCHRLTTSGIFVLQYGDPTGKGTGGPGYKFNDENLTGAAYPAATIAMANSGPNTNGSQFFLVYKDTSLPPSYTPFGTIVSGLDVLTKVAAAGTASGSGDGQPKEKVVIESITIKKT